MTPVHVSQVMQSRRTRIVLGAALAAVTLALAACSSGSSGSGSSGEVTQLSLAIGTPSWNAGFAPLAIAEAEGYFAQEKLAVTVNLFPSGTQIAQQVAAGQSDVGLVTPEPLAVGHDKNLNLVYFAQYWPHWIYSVTVPAGSKVSNIADLKGARVGVTAVASSGATFVRTAMTMQGLDPESITLVPIGAGAQQINAIKGGQVDALAMWDTQYQIVQNAGVVLKPLAVPGTEKLFGGGFAVTKETLKNKQDALIRLGRAVAKGLAFAQANPAAAVHDLWKLHPEAKDASTPDEQQLADQIKVLQVRMDGQKVGAGEGDRWGYMDPDAVTGAIKFMAAAKLMDSVFPATDIFTNDLVDKINSFSYDEIRAAAKKAT